MRKYFFLKKGNEWSRGLFLVELLFLIFLKKIKRFDTIWHTGLCPEGMLHPDKCIHSSIHAKEISYIPNWLFQEYYGISDLLKRINKKLKRIVSKGDSFEEFAKKPLEMPKLLENAIEKKLIPSIRAIHSLCSGGEYSIDLVFITEGNEPQVVRKTYKIVLKEIKPNYIEFQILLPKIPNVGGVMYQESYGLNNELYLENKVNKLRVLPNSVTNFSTKFPYEPQILKGQFTQINQVVPSDFKDVYIRLIIPISATTEPDIKTPLSILERSGDIVFDKEVFNIQDSIMGVKFRIGSGYSEIIVNGRKYHFYSARKSLIVLECLNKNDLDSFKLEAEQIRLALAFLSGSYYRSEAYYLTSHSDDFAQIEGVWYEKELAEVITINQIINPTFFFQNFRDKNAEYQEKYKKYHTAFSTNLFSELCNIMLSEDEIQRAIKLLVNGSGNDDPIQKGALYSVAIETLTGFLSEKNKENLKPIQDKLTAKKILEELTNVLASNSKDIGEEGLEILKRKIESINNPTNRDKLIKPFEIYGIELTEENIQTVGKRNDYLHGRSPIKTEDQFELNKLALELHYLAACLILKYIGYEGHVINLPIWSIFKNKEKFRELLETKTLNEMELLEQLKDSIAQANEKKFHEMKALLKEFYETLEIRNLIKFI